VSREAGGRGEIANAPTIPFVPAFAGTNGWGLSARRLDRGSVRVPGLAGRGLRGLHVRRP
jgi:hypothetical protein